ncbi:protein arginine N-methyltransferase 1-like [Mizuhopecten yessoensis]|uniref:type I protein arginine methyltransferase n=1 Tax=Mizuhopecten yessoensis TaxID=6573 RepID=A0A210QYN7_MIZYE|nr:protein arginine N-methyltransferase 1-like [Mizuhopecten yessoensis]XP_021346385.1 protein arginine N-methyltransferase 1-like [Mizuhopecten yessoensis]OWF53846.1 protein arginine N-methyltransferase 6 [Mizuhopecten yessoensis]
MNTSDTNESPEEATAGRVSNSAYFTSYGDLGVHELMLKDKPRTLAYKGFIEKNSHLFKDKTVLDVGAGTGILSLFAASAGAKIVYAVEASGMASACEKIVEQNNLKDRIVVIHGRVESVDLPVNKVDIIISEWMGFYLFHESMLDSVIVARDRWLAPSGLMLPSVATLYMMPVSMDDYIWDHFQFWDNVYGYDLSPLKSTAMMNAIQQPVITTLSTDEQLAEPQTVVDLNLYETTLYDIEQMYAKLSYKILTDSTVHGFAAWFDVDFQGPAGTSPQNSCTSVTLSTAPGSSPTHWKQTVFFLPSAFSVQEGETITCKLELSQDQKNKRQYNISLEMVDKDEESEDDFDTGDDEESSNHPVPCTCGASRCQLITAIMDKYECEHAQLEQEAELVGVTAEREAANEMMGEEFSPNDL